MPDTQKVYDYSDIPTIKAFSHDDSFIRGVMGPFGSGKSSGCVLEIGQRAAEQKPGPDGVRRTRWAVVRNTYRELVDTSLKTWLDWFPDGIAGRWHAADHIFHARFQDVSAEIMFRALDKPGDVKKLLSLELTGAWINEAREIPKTIFEALQGRVGRFPAQIDGGPTWYGLILDTNPPDQDSWWFKLFEEICPSNARLFKQPSGLSEKAENLSNLPGGRRYYENLAVGKKDEFVKVYIRGEYGFIIDGKAIYEHDYEDSEHCREFEPIKGIPIDRGWDFGLTPACVLTQVTPGGKWLVIDEIIGESIGAERFGKEVKMYCNSNYPGFRFTDTGDPAGQSPSESDEKTCFQILNGQGFDMTPGQQSLEIRIGSVRKPLSTRGGFLMHPKCKTLRKGFMGGYHYRKIQVGEDRYDEKPNKNLYSHPHDALQYVATRIFSDKVLGVTSNSTIRVETDFQIHRRGYDEVVQVESDFRV